MEHRRPADTRPRPSGWRIEVPEYSGIRALFNGDLHLIDPSWAPREDWIVIDARAIEHVRPVGQR